MERRAVIFRGRVQGVGFRATTRDVASGHDVTGWVRNEPDGSVRCEVQGASEAVDGFLEDLEGRMARYIDSRRVDPIGLAEGERGFAIRR